MHKSNTKRFLSFVMALAMVVSLLPLQIFAEEVDVSELVLEEESPEVVETAVVDDTAAIVEETTVEETVAEPEIPETTAAVSENLTLVQDEINRVLETYGIAVDMTTEQIHSAVAAMNDDAYWEALVACVELEESDAFLNLTEAEQMTLVETNAVYSDFSSAIYARRANEDIAFFTTVSALDGQVSLTDTANTIKNSSGTVTATAKGGLLSKKSNTITITNATENPATLSFNYTVDKSSSFTIDGANAATTGSYSKLLEAGKSVTVVITSNSGFSNLTVTLTMTNISLTAAATSSNVTINYDSALGSVTAGGSAVASGTTKEVSLAEGIALAATANSGVIFLGWVEEGTGKIAFSSASFTYTPAEDVTLRAVFVTAGSNAWFSVGSDYMFATLTEAVEYAKTASAKTIVPTHDGKLPAGNYTIPGGVTLLIPYNDSNTVCTTSPAVDTSGGFLSTTANKYAKPTPYRTLTMETGANITINGAMSLSGKQSSQQVYNGCPTGPLSFVTMESGSSITVANGGFLYTWGYITGSGSVTVESGGTVYEDFQVKDWRGGTAASDMIGADEMVFPVSQYYVQNIEVPMTLKAGAKEYGYFSFVASKMGFETDVPFVGDGCMFVIGQGGSVTKDYLEDADRLQIDINGSVTMSSLVLTVTGYNMNSEEYVLPITNNLSVNINSGTTTVSQDMAVLPGAEITVAEGASFILASKVNMYIYDTDEWIGRGFVYSKKDYSPLSYANKGTPKSRALSDAKIEINGNADLSAGYLYTTSGGANICSTGNGVLKTTKGTATITYQYDQANSTYVEIPITPAKLKNGDGSVVASGSDTYTYTEGFWRCSSHTYDEGQVTDEATCSKEGVKIFTCSICKHVKTDSIPKTSHTEVIDAAKLPTYAEVGKTEGKHCSVCGEVLIAQQPTNAAQVGDITYQILKEAIAAADRHKNVVLLSDINGDVPVGKHVTIEKGSYTANIVADTGFTLAENGTATTVLIKIIATNMKASDGLDLFFYVNSNTLSDKDGYIARVTRTYADGTSETMDAALESYNATLTRFCYEAIAAKEMTDTVTGMICYKDGTPASNSYTESVKNYAMRTLAAQESDSMLTPALVDMLNYGAGAQTHFDYATDNLANADDNFSEYTGTTEDVELKDTLVKGENLAAVSVSAKNKLMMTFYFQNITQQMHAEISYTDHYGQEVKYTISGDKFYPRNNWFGVDVAGVPVANGRALITCEVYDGNKLIGSASDSVEGYSARTAEKGYAVAGVMQQLMRFVDSAAAYFKSTK